MLVWVPPTFCIRPVHILQHRRTKLLLKRIQKHGTTLFLIALEIQWIAQKALKLTENQEKLHWPSPHGHRLHMKLLKMHMYFNTFLQHAFSHVELHVGA